MIREVIFKSKDKKMYHAQAYIGLDKEFMVKAHLLVLKDMKIRYILGL